jgi:hypothetical protein
MDNNMYIEDIFKGVLTGVFATYLIILGMRPAAIYPDNILDIIDNPWIFLILFILNYYILFWDFTIGLLFFLTLIALILDIIIFTDGDFIKDNMDIVNTNFFNTAAINDALRDAKDTKDTKDTRDAKDTRDTKDTRDDSKSYKDVNDIILEQLKHYNKLNEGSDSIKAHNSFL